MKRFRVLSESGKGCDLYRVVGRGEGFRPDVWAVLASDAGQKGLSVFGFWSVDPRKQEPPKFEIKRVATSTIGKHNLKDDQDYKFIRGFRLDDPQLKRALLRCGEAEFEEVLSLPFYSYTQETEAQWLGLLASVSAERQIGKDLNAELSKILARQNAKRESLEKQILASF